MVFRQYRRTTQLGRLVFQGLSATTCSRMHPAVLSERYLLQVSLRYASTDRSKVEYTLKMLKEDLMQQDEEARRRLVPASTTPQQKLTLTQKIVAECKHYYHGFRLLALETRLSAKYMWRVLRGDKLSRRERQQLVCLLIPLETVRSRVQQRKVALNFTRTFEVRTVSDLFRIVPFSIFIIVPFLELTLPIFIKLFPNMLPSTFQESNKQDEKLRKQVQLKVQMAKFLQDTIEEIALERRSKAVESKGSKAVEFAQFIKKVRSEGGYVSNKDLLKFTKLFEDELTLDNLSMSQLRSLCRLMSIQPFGTPEILRFQLQMKLRELKADDKQIAAEGGVETLNTIDLQQACRARGMRAAGLSQQRLREQLGQWLELSLNDKIPPSLLLLSRALYLPEDISFTDRLKALVQSLPEGIAESTRQKLTELEGGKVDHKARLDLIKQIEEAIAKEKAIDEAKQKEDEKILQVKAEEAQTHVATPPEASVSAAVSETAAKITEAAAAATKALYTAKKDLVDVVQEAVDQAKAVEKEKVAAAEATVDPKDLSSIEEILVGGPIDEAKNEILELKEKAIEHTEDLVEITALDSGFSESKVAKRLRTKLNTMIDNVDTLVSKLEEEKRAIKETIADPAMGETAAAKMEKQVRVQDLIDALTKLQSKPAKDGESAKEAEARRARVEQLLTAIDHDEDGIIDADLVLEVIALVEKHGDIKMSASQLASIFGMLKKEDEAEELVKKLESLDAPIMPQGPAMDDESEEAADSSKKGKNGVLDIPNVDPKVTAPLRSKNGNNGAARPDSDKPPA